MNKRNVLIIGGYGAIGTHISKRLIKYDDLSLTIAGRDKDKATRLAKKLNCNQLYVDNTNEHSLVYAINKNDIIINCALQSEGHNPLPAKVCIQLSKDYIDIASAPFEHMHAIVDMHVDAHASGSTLITGFGVNPGVIGVLIKMHADDFDHINECNSYFTLGSDMSDMSVLSFRNITHMMRINPKVWKSNSWLPTAQTSIKAWSSEPFEKNIYFGQSIITPDIEHIPHIHSIDSLQLWSGLEGFAQSMIMFMIAKFGMTKTDKTTKLFLPFIKFLGNRKTYKAGSNFKIVTQGKKDGKLIERTTSFDTKERRPTAIGAEIACRQIIEKKIDAKGAFYPTDIINTNDFLEKIQQESAYFVDSYTEV